MENLTLSVKSPSGLFSAMAISQSCMAPVCVINCGEASNMFRAAPLQELHAAASYFGSIDGGFGKSQLRTTAYEYRQYPLADKISVKISRTYMCSPKELNDVRCVAAEIAGILKTNLGERCSFEKTVREYQKWINNHFNYRNTGNLSDHSAIGLLTNRTGVCQSIAAVTMLVFPHLGYPIAYVCGNARGEHGWEPHAWNAVKTERGWVHVDFTFGMASFYTPNTGGLFAKAFRRNHKWDEKALSPANMSACGKIYAYVRKSTIELFENSRSFTLGEVTVNTPEPMLIRGKGGGDWVNLFRLLPLLGGACELLPGGSRLRICLFDRQILIPNANALVNGQNGYISVSVLSSFGVILGGNGSSARFKIKQNQ